MRQRALLVETLSLGDSKSDDNDDGVDTIANAATSLLGVSSSSESLVAYSSCATNTILGAFLKNGFFGLVGFF